MDSYSKKRNKNDLIVVIKILSIIVGFLIILGLGFLFYLSRNSGDYGTNYKDKGFKIDKKYVIENNKAEIIKRLIARHPYSDTSANIIDSLFVIYLDTYDNISFSALVDIKGLNNNKTTIKLDSIIGYSIPAIFDSIREKTIIAKYDSIKMIGLFDSLVIKKISLDKFTEKTIFFDNVIV